MVAHEREGAPDGKPIERGEDEGVPVALRQRSDVDHVRRRGLGDLLGMMEPLEQRLLLRDRQVPLEERDVDALFLLEVHLEEGVEPEERLAELGTRLHPRHPLLHRSEALDGGRDMEHLLRDLLVVDLHRLGRATVLSHDTIDGRVEIGLLRARMREQVTLEHCEERVQIVARPTLEGTADVIRELRADAPMILVKRLADTPHARLLVRDGSRVREAPHPARRDRSRRPAIHARTIATSTSSACYPCTRPRRCFARERSRPSS